MAALRTIGSAQDKKEDVNQFCICAAVEITRAVMAKVGAKPESYDHDDAFVGGIFARLRLASSHSELADHLNWWRWQQCR
jgi:hypothetical protein